MESHAAMERIGAALAAQRATHLDAVAADLSLLKSALCGERPSNKESRQLRDALASSLPTSTSAPDGTLVNERAAYVATVAARKEDKALAALHDKVHARVRRAYCDVLLRLGLPPTASKRRAAKRKRDRADGADDSGSGASGGGVLVGASGGMTIGAVHAADGERNAARV